MVSNRSAIGARVRVVAGGVSRIREVSGGSGYMSQNALTLAFGLGPAAEVDTLEIRWPSGTVCTYVGFPVDRRLTIGEDCPVTGVEEERPVRRFLLHANTPNPFGAGTLIRYELAETVPVRLQVLDLRGSLVRRLEDRSRDAGIYGVEWDGRDDAGRKVGAGVYFYRLQAGSMVAVRKMVVLR
jgi:hypothetical protein